jgi:hypothetical protein
LEGNNKSEKQVQKAKSRFPWGLTSNWTGLQTKAATFAGRGSVDLADALDDFYLFRVARKPD